MSVKSVVFWALCSLPLFAAFASAAPDGEIETIVRRVCDENVSIAGGEAAIRAAFEALPPLEGDGWADVDYAGTNASLWSPAEHLFRLKTYCLFHCVSRGRTDAAVREAIVRLYDGWFRRFGTDIDPKRCPNWWYREIGVPRLLGAIGLLARDLLSDGRRAQALEAMAAAGFVSPVCGPLTGQNIVYVSNCMILRALIAGDRAGVLTGRDGIAGTIVPADGMPEGIRADGTFHQHGDQPQFGGYGSEYMDDVSFWVKMLGGTFAAFPKGKTDLLLTLADGYAWVIRDGRLDVSSLDRQLRKGAAAEKGSRVTNSIARLGAELRAPLGYRYFDESALAVYRAPRFTASVKMSTPTIRGTEKINFDNQYGCCLADGALYVSVTGEEYVDIHPLWRDWRLVPGITTYRSLPLVWTWSSYDGGSGYMDYEWNASETGIESDAAARSLVYRFSRSGLSFVKRWRFSDAGVSVDVSDVTAGGTDEVVTCVDHVRALPDAAVVSRTPTRTVVRNGKVRYTIDAPRERVSVKIECRTGNWRDSYPSGPFLEETGRVLEILVSHGAAPSKDGFSYRIDVEP